MELTEQQEHEMIERAEAGDPEANYQMFIFMQDQVISEPNEERKEQLNHLSAQYLVRAAEAGHELAMRKLNALIGKTAETSSPIIDESSTPVKAMTSDNLPKEESHDYNGEGALEEKNEDAVLGEGEIMVLFDNAISCNDEDEAIIYGSDLIRSGELIHVMLGFKKLALSDIEQFSRSASLYMHLTVRLSRATRNDEGTASTLLNANVKEIGNALELLETYNGEDLDELRDYLTWELICWYVLASEKSAGEEKSDYESKYLSLIKRSYVSHENDWIQEYLDFLKLHNIQLSSVNADDIVDSSKEPNEDNIDDSPASLPERKDTLSDESHANQSSGTTMLSDESTTGLVTVDKVESKRKVVVWSIVAAAIIIMIVIVAILSQRNGQRQTSSAYTNTTYSSDSQVASGEPAIQQNNPSGEPSAEAYLSATSFIESIRDADLDAYPSESDVLASPISAVVSANLSLRTGPGTQYSVLEVIPNGASITIYARFNGWALVNYNWRWGWCFNDYITEENSVIASGTCGNNLSWTLSNLGTLTIDGTGRIESAPWDANSPIITKLVISEGVTSIPEYLFAYCDNLKSVELPTTLDFVGFCAFQWASSLESVYIKDLNKWLEIQFDHCPMYPGAALYVNGQKIETLIIPENVKVIPALAFEGCSSITTLVLPNVEEIGRNSFKSCCNLRSIYLPKSLTYIGSEAFSYDHGPGMSITDVYYEGTEAEWNQITIDGYNDYLLSATIHFESEWSA